MRIPGTSLARLLPVILLLWTLPADALSPNKSISQYVHTAWQNVDGLPQNTVTSIAQTGDGYLWLGTLEGLVRFDGAQFKLYNTRTNPRFTHNFVVSLVTDRRDRLWIATSGGGLLVYKNDYFTQVGTAEGLPSAQVSVVYEDLRGNIWVGTDGGGLARVIQGQLRFEVPFPDIGREIRTISETKAGVWIGTEDGLVLLRRDDSQRRFTRADGLSHPSVRALLPERSGVLWVSTDMGVDVLSLGDFKPLEYEQARGDDVVLAMHQDRGGRVWMGSDGGGLKLWDNGEITRFTAQEGLSNDSVLTLFESADGSLWAGTNLGGLNRFKDGRITTYTRREGLAHDFVRAVFEDTRGNLWIGTEGGGLVRYRDGQFNTFDTSHGLPDNTVYALAENKVGDLWIGTDNGLARMRDDQFSVYQKASGLSDNTILSLAMAPDDSLWVGTYAGGLHRLQNGRASAIDAELPNNTINALHQSASGELWIGTRGGGLAVLADGALRSYDTADGLSDDLVFAFHEDANGDMWIGTYGGGINRYRNGRFSAVTEAQGMFDDVVHRIIDDGRGRFWMSSNRGVFSVDKDALSAVANGNQPALHSQVYGYADGMKNVECNGGSNAGARTSDGTIWFPSVAGLVSVDPRDTLERGELKDIMIEAIHRDGERLHSRSLDLEAGTRNLDIQYTLTDLLDAEKLRFRYRLVGHDEHWIDAGSRRSAWYSQLAGGDYSFEVQADYGAGTWQTTGQTLLLRVAPHYYETSQFRVAAVLSALLLVYLVYRLRVRNLTRRTLALEDVVTMRTAELEAANRQLSQLASEDGLTGLLNRRAFDEALREECRRAERTGLPLALLLLDLDYFKQFNDAYGHQAGDECLQRIARTLMRACSRAGEVVARYGGEEIAIILPAISQENAIVHAQAMRQQIRDLGIAHSGSSADDVVTASIGMTCLVPTPDLTPGDLLTAADKALYLAKENGRNRVEFGLEVASEDAR